MAGLDPPGRRRGVGRGTPGPGGGPARRRDRRDLGHPGLPPGGDRGGHPHRRLPAGARPGRQGRRRGDAEPVGRLPGRGVDRIRGRGVALHPGHGPGRGRLRRLHPGPPPGRRGGGRAPERPGSRGWPALPRPHRPRQPVQRGRLHPGRGRSGGPGRVPGRPPRPARHAAPLRRGPHRRGGAPLAGPAGGRLRPHPGPEPPALGGAGSDAVSGDLQLSVLPGADGFRTGLTWRLPS
jgi:translation initiation factor IF-2